MPTALQDRIRNAITTADDLNLTFDPQLNALSPGRQNVYLPALGANEIRVDLDSGNAGEAAAILWLRWQQGEMPSRQANSISNSAPNTLFLT